MSRVTPDEVREIFITDMLNAPLQVFIDSANSIINATLVGALPEATLKHIERFLSAHLASTLERRDVSIRVGNASVQYSGKFGMGLDSTDYGQAVKLLDTTGKLSDIGKGSASMDIMKFYTDCKEITS